ncbi:hypothetical protein BGZ75_000002 [Mortierella antarctica]|nr:hypothetical protein BGZ75_000002 [Mortierella antarctica]
MLQERALYSHNHSQDLVQGQPTESQMDDLVASAVDPWRHLFPKESALGGQDEFSSVTQTQTQTMIQTQTQTQTQTREVNGQEHVRKIVDNTVHVVAEDTKPEEASFQPELWARIQMRYAPTISHLQSLFRCLHVDAEATRGRTFGEDIEDSSSESEQSRTSVPSLILLIGCFESEDKTDLSSRPTLPIDRSASSTEAFSSLPVHHRQPMHAYSAPHGELWTLRRGNGDQECVNHIKAISKAMSEIKDSLEWIHRRSGRKPELVLFEDTIPNTNNGTQLQTGTQVHEQLGPSMPSPQELWLQKVLGFWVDAMITIERDDSVNQERHHVEVTIDGSQMEASPREHWKSVVSKDAYRLWIRTHKSIMAMVSSSDNSTVAPWMDEGDTGLATASSGAVLGLRWHVDIMDSRFHLQVLT